MNSSRSSVYTSSNAYSYAAAGTYYDTTQLYHSSTDYASGLDEDPSSSAGEWSVDHVGLGACFDADRAFFEELLNAEVTSTSPSGPCTMVPMQSLPSYDQEASFLPPPQPAFEQGLPVATETLISPYLIYPSLHDVHDPDNKYSITAMTESSHVGCCIARCSTSSPPYPSPSPEASRQMSQCSNMFAYTAHPPMPLAFGQPLPETTVTCISLDLIYPSARYDPEDDRWTDASSQSSRASHRSSSSSPYPDPSPEPSLRTSSIVIASRRRNAPARTAAPFPTKTWQCPHCPYVQRNRRSPDLKRHIKTHTRDAEVADWVCCGIPVMNATELCVPTTTMREAHVFDFDGVLMIGGCRKAFSRRDALRRHLQREKEKCFGDALSLHQRGNRESC